MLYHVLHVHVYTVTYDARDVCVQDSVQRYV